MLVQKPAVLKGKHQCMQKLLLLPCQPKRIRRIYGRKIHIQHRIFLPWYHHSPLLKIDRFHQQAVIHLILRMPLDDLSLYLELKHSNRLMHLGHQPGIYHIIDILIQNLRCKTRTGIILIYPCRKHGQRPEINPIAILQHIKAVIADGDPQDIAHTGFVPCRCSHPGDIMIPPLNIHIMETHQLIHNNIRPWSPVKNISDNMKIVNGKILNQIA